MPLIIDKGINKIYGNNKNRGIASKKDCAKLILIGFWTFISLTLKTRI